MGSETQTDETRAGCQPCVLMFSGGRDSSLAAMRLHAEGRPLILVTVSSDHLFGIDRVKCRLKELAAFLPPETQWIRIRQPKGAASFGSAFGRTCLPCQHDYALAGAMIARQLGVADLAFGYASYQSDWPEQNPVATAALAGVLTGVGINLLLPVYALSSKEQAKSRLADLGMSEDALEQKCSKQVFNIALDANELERHLDHWSDELRKSLTTEVNVEVLEKNDLGVMERS